MGNRKAIVFAAAAAALAVVAWLWSAVGTPAPLDSAAPSASAPAVPNASAPAPAPEMVAPETTALAEVAPADDEVSARETRAAVPVAGVLLEGRVLLPEGTPADERLVVYAVDHARKGHELAGHFGLADMAWDPGRERAEALVARAEVAPDGSFALALPEGTETAHVALTGRYLFSRATTAVSLPAAGPTILTGELGAWVTGTLLPPAGAGLETPELERIDVRLTRDLAAGFDLASMGAMTIMLSSTSTDAGSFEFRGVRTAGGYLISAIPDGFAALHRDGIAPERGEHLQLDLHLQRGATLRGRVVDSAGEAVSGALVEVHGQGSFPGFGEELREAVTGPDGSFELPHVALGKLTLKARRPGLLEVLLKVDTEGANEVVRGGLLLVMESGGTIAGWVTYPDGSPAEGVKVRAPLYKYSMATVDARTDDAGHFELTSLPGDWVELKAQVEHEDGAHAGMWKLSDERAEVGGEPLHLVLERLLVLRGRVLDRAGAPVPAFRVSATLQTEQSSTPFGMRGETLDHKVDAAEDGMFVMQEFTPGTWAIRIRARGFASSPAQVVTLRAGEPTPELLFTLDPGASAAGRVVDPGGAPVAGASVSEQLDMANRMQAMMGNGVEVVLTDVNGEFLLESLDPGTLSLVASHDGYAGSEVVRCELVSGQVTGDLLLQMHLGGTLTGVVFDHEGKPAGDRMIMVQSSVSSSSTKMQATDELGEFRIEHLAPGTWQVMAMPNFMNRDDEDEDEDEPFGGMQMGTAEIVDGQETHLVLGAPPSDPVQLHGRVTRAGAPVSGAELYLMPNSGGLVTPKTATTAPDGSFDLQLDQPGAYRIAVQPDTAEGRDDSVEFLELIPEGVADHELVLELPGGSIAGLVRGPDGAPLAACRVTFNVEGGVSYGAPMQQDLATVLTDEQGHYEARYLRAGTYAVAAGGAAWRSMVGFEEPTSGQAGGRAVQAGVRLGEGQALAGVDFLLEEAASLTGTVLGADGSPAEGASIFVRDGAGRVMERMSVIATDVSGRFKYPGLGAGSYSISARKGDLVSTESEIIEVLPGGSGELRVTLEAGTILRVAVTDGSDAELQATIRVQDAEGREFAGLRSLVDLMGNWAASISIKEHRVGPLPPGEYKVTATHADGRVKSRTVRLSGQAERKVKLRLN